MKAREGRPGGGSRVKTRKNRQAQGAYVWASVQVSIDNRNVFANNHMAHMGSASDVFSDLILHEPRIARNVPPTRDAVPGPSTLTPSGSGAPAGGSLHQAQKRQQGQRSPMPAMFPGPGLQVSSVSPPSQVRVWFFPELTRSCVWDIGMLGGDLSSCARTVPWGWTA